MTPSDKSMLNSGHWLTGESGSLPGGTAQPFFYRLVAEVAPTRSTYMGSPVISHQRAPVVGRLRRQRSVYCKGPGNIRVAMETTLVNCDTAVVLQCKGKCLVEKLSAFASLPSTSLQWLRQWLM